jgi:hypothetical protein
MSEQMIISSSSKKRVSIGYARRWEELRSKMAGAACRRAINGKAEKRGEIY